MAVSAGMRDYLAEIYRLQQEQAYVTTSSLADRLDVSPPAVARMVRRLKGLKLVAHEPYRGVRLTAAGEREALRAIRRHRLLEVFLVQVMGFGWEEGHGEADALAPGVSDAFEDRMDELTGHPTRCPHGEPIPSKDGVMPVINDVNLITLKVGMRGTISRVRTRDPEKLRYLASLGLVPGTAIQVVGRGPFDGPVRLRLGREEHVLGVAVAGVLFVEV